MTEKILDTVAVTRRFQVTITRPVREVLPVEEGDRLVFIKKNGDVVLRKT